MARARKSSAGDHSNKAIEEEQRDHVKDSLRYTQFWTGIHHSVDARNKSKDFREDATEYLEVHM